MKLWQHNFTIDTVVKFLTKGLCSESGLHSLPSRSSRCPRLDDSPRAWIQVQVNKQTHVHWMSAGSTIHFCKAGSHWAISSSENQRAVSLAEFWTESAPWITFIEVIWPKSPRILPISALQGSVAPISLLASLKVAKS